MDLGTLIKVGTQIVGGVKSIGGFFKENPHIGTAASFFANKSQTDSSYQRAMRDMKKAGLNPLLAGKLGGAQSAVMGDLGQVMNTAQQIDINKQSQKVQEFKTIAEVAEANQRISESLKRVEKLGVEVNNIVADTLMKLAQEGKLKSETDYQNIINQTLQDHPNAEYWKTVGNDLLPIITTAGGLLLTGYALTPAGRVTKFAQQIIQKHFPKLHKYFSKNGLHNSGY